MRTSGEDGAPGQPDPGRADAPAARGPAMGGPNSLGAVSLALVGAMVVMSTAVIAPVLPDIAAHFHDDPRVGYLVPLLVTAPALTIAIAAPVAGIVLDRFGRHRAVLAALVGFVLFGIAGVVGNSLEWLLWTRAGLGVCVAFLTAGFTSLVGDLFSPPQRAVMLGRQVSLNAVMSLFMTIAGGILAEWHWRGMFLIYLTAVPLVFMFARYVPRRPARAAVPAGDEAPRGAGGAVWGTIAAIYMLAVLCMFFSMLVPTRTPFLMQERYGASASLIAVSMAVFTLGMLPASAMFPRLRRSLSPRQMFALGFAFMAVGFVLLGFAPALAMLVAANGVTGFGFGFIMPNLSTSLLASAPPALRGRLAGGLASSMFFGQFVSPIFSQPLVLRFGIETTFLISAAFIAAVALMCLIRAPRK